MSASSRFQTVRLSRGRHREPGSEVCVMELASMLAGARFCDRGEFASPVIGAFLRVYNDGLDDDARQELYVYASKVIGTRATRAAERERARMCRQWARQQTGRSRRWAAALHRETAGAMAARVALGDRSAAGRRAAMAFVDELIDVYRQTPSDLAVAIPDHVPAEWVARRDPSAPTSPGNPAPRRS